MGVDVGHEAVVLQVHAVVVVAVVLEAEKGGGEGGDKRRGGGRGLRGGDICICIRVTQGSSAYDWLRG